ncbi:hypothetical protein [Nocardioides sp. WS12]|uniref:hypothetical protein n=1 Tax=Nocardioides sp. WS12 TaxID=2486272 RepID=UPI0015F8122A|nr:hypothetical protein [Nocardioides sp. WS12]
MGQAAALQVLAELADRRDCGNLDPIALASWVAVARRANKARNHVMHSPWVIDQGADTVSVLVNGSMKMASRSDDDLREDINDLARAVIRASNLLASGSTVSDAGHA